MMEFFLVPPGNLIVVSLFQLPFIVTLIWLDIKRKESWLSILRKYALLHVLNSNLILLLCPAWLLLTTAVNGHEWYTPVSGLLGLLLLIPGLFGCISMIGQLLIIHYCCKIKLSRAFGFWLFVVNWLGFAVYVQTPLGASWRTEP
jgi:hypothetical protein